MEPIKTITLDGVVHDVDKFSDGIKQAVGIYHKFNLQLQDERLAVMKTEAALATIGRQIADAASNELKAKEAAGAAVEEDGSGSPD
jgi:hypothetical protein